jgi:lysozyme
MMPIANVIDMFHGDNREEIPDFVAMKNAGVIAVIHKSTQGLGFKDPRCAVRLQAARDAGLLVGAYHFLTYGDSANQAQYFLQCANLQPGDLAALDFETSGATPNADQALQWLRAVRIARNAFPAIYGSDLVRQNFNAQSPVSRYPLWLAEYGPHENIPPPWSTSLFWQFSEAGNVAGIAGHVDTNFFDGTQGDLAAIFNATSGEAP